MSVFSLELIVSKVVMDLHLPCEDPSINDLVPIWNPSAVAHSERLRLQGINFINFHCRSTFQFFLDMFMKYYFHLQFDYNIKNFIRIFNN